MKKILFYLVAFSFTFQALGEVPKRMKTRKQPKHVILVGFDGMSSQSIIKGVDMPKFRTLMNEGAQTLENRSILPSSSACNWASMYMGAGPELHGFNTWGSTKPDLPSRVLTENGFFPDIFYLIKQQDEEAKTAHFYEWGGMYYLADTTCIDHLEQLKLSVPDNDKAIIRVADYIVKEKPTFCSIVFDQPDGAGHRYGWESKEYYDQLSDLDRKLTLLTDRLEKSDMFDETVIVLVSDHGGIKRGHGGITMDEMQTPIVFVGKGVKVGHEIQESTMVYDIPATVAYMLGVVPPQVWIGRPILSIFE